MTDKPMTDYVPRVGDVWDCGHSQMTVERIGFTFSVLRCSGLMYGWHPYFENRLFRSLERDGWRLVYRVEEGKEQK